MSERQILITITAEHWGDEIQEELIKQIDNECDRMLVKGDYTIQEFEK